VETQSGSVILPWPKQPSVDAAPSQRVARVLALLRAIDSGELLSALPDCPIAQFNHQTAQTMLAAAEIELSRLRDELIKEHG
jgi:hypothetical protein